MASKLRTAGQGSRVETITMSRTHVLIDQALENINEIRRVGQDAKANEDFEEVNTQLSIAENYFSAIKHIDGLQTHDFSTDIEAAIVVLQNCESLFKKLPRNSMKQNQVTIEQIRYEKQLKPMQGLLDEALQKISSRVLNTPVGLTENCHVRYSSLYETNEKVKEVFGNNLALMEFLEKENMIDKQDSNGNINLGPAKVETFKLSVSQQSSSDAAAQTPSSEKVTEQYDRAVIRNNTAGRNFTTVTSNIGFEAGYKAPYAGTSQFLNNKLGDDGTVITGDITGQAGVELFNHIFGKRVRRE